MDIEPTPLEQDENFDFFKAHEFEAKVPCSASMAKGFREVHCPSPATKVFKFNHTFGVKGRRECKQFAITLCTHHADELEKVSVPGLIDGIIKNKGLCPSCGQAAKSLEDVFEIVTIS